MIFNLRILYWFIYPTNIESKGFFSVIVDFYFLQITCSHLQRRSLISEAVEDAAAAAQEVVHASVCVVQVGVQLKSLIYGDGGICVLSNNNKHLNPDDSAGDHLSV